MRVNVRSLRLLLWLGTTGLTGIAGLKFYEIFRDVKQNRYMASTGQEFLEGQVPESYRPRTRNLRR